MPAGSRSPISPRRRGTLSPQFGSTLAGKPKSHGVSRTASPSGPEGCSVGGGKRRAGGKVWRPDGVSGIPVIRPDPAYRRVGSELGAARALADTVALWNRIPTRSDRKTAARRDSGEKPSRLPSRPNLCNSLAVDAGGPKRGTAQAAYQRGAGQWRQRPSAATFRRIGQASPLPLRRAPDSVLRAALRRVRGCGRRWTANP